MPVNHVFAVDAVGGGGGGGWWCGGFCFVLSFFQVDCLWVVVVLFCFVFVFCLGFFFFFWGGEEGLFVCLFCFVLFFNS